MNLLIAADLKDIPKIQDSFSNLTRIKGDFPTIKNCHDFVNSNKYDYDEKTRSGGIKKDYPLNILHKLKEYLKEYDIVVVPIDNKLLKAVRKYKKIKRVCIYEENVSSYHDSDIMTNMFMEEIENY